jgi:hypothetical protein
MLNYTGGFKTFRSAIKSRLWSFTLQLDGNQQPCVQISRLQHLEIFPENSGSKLENPNGFFEKTPMWHKKVTAMGTAGYCWHKPASFTCMSCIVHVIAAVQAVQTC